MSNYENKACPVCSKEFVDGDDIVVCPECGTPHHRECYNMIGHCVNKGLHKANYDYNEDTKDIIKTATEEANDFHQKEESASSIPNPFAIPEVDAQFENDREKIAGEDVADIAATVRLNAGRYIAKFKELEASGKKLSWNWSGFFFGSFYLLYRKMYKIGTGFFSVILALFFGANALIYKISPNFIAGVTEIANMANQKIQPTVEQIEAVAKIADAKNASMIVYGLLAIILVFHIIIALISDYCYKSNVIAIVKNVKEQLELGASFTQAPMMIGGDLNMTQEQMKKMYLARKGGTSFFAPAIALLILGFIF